MLTTTLRAPRPPNGAHTDPAGAQPTSWLRDGRTDGRTAAHHHRAAQGAEHSSSPSGSRSLQRWVRKGERRGGKGRAKPNPAAPAAAPHAAQPGHSFPCVHFIIVKSNKINRMGSSKAMFLLLLVLLLLFIFLLLCIGTSSDNAQTRGSTRTRGTPGHRGGRGVVPDC